jgi:Tfp pilus assembly protein PilF
MLLHDRGIIFMGYGGNDRGIHKLLHGLPREALPYGAYWVHPEKPSGEVRKWLASRQGVWVRSGWFDEVMLLILNEFKLDHPNRDRFTRIFSDYQQKFQDLSKSIEDGATKKANAQALEKALVAAADTFTDFWKVVSQASRLERKDPDGAAEVYRKEVEQFPDAAPLLGNYALFLENVRKDPAAAEAMYRRAIEADPNHANNLGNYAIFLNNVRKDPAAAEVMYKRAIEADPNHARNLGNYAIFLNNVRKDLAAAEAMYKRAIEADPNHANNLGNYAAFLHANRNDSAAAESMYRRLLASDPQNANISANLAGLLLATGKPEGLQFLDRALGLLSKTAVPSIQLECEFYRFAHGVLADRQGALRNLRTLIEQDARSPGWDLSSNIQRTLQDGHPEGPWLSKLAAVVNGDAQPRVLNDWPAWQAAAAARSSANTDAASER